MNKRKKYYWILLGIAIFILFIGIMVAIAFSPRAFVNDHAQRLFNKNWDELTSGQQDWLKTVFPDVARAAEKADRQRRWVNTWILTPIRLFVILTVAIVTSWVILNKIVPKLAQRRSNARLK